MAEHRGIPLETRQAQALASNPEMSAWVSANAGSGKTFVLARRVIRLLLNGVAPGKILCLTYTKAAAAEMSNRIFEILAHWAACDETSLQKALDEVLGEAADSNQLRRARILFALALDTPGGLKIQTIHAFCEALLHQFPLEANVSGHFEVLEAMAQDALVEEARHQVLVALQQGESAQSELNRAFTHLVAIASDHQIDTAIREILATGEAFLDWISGDVAGAMAGVRERLGFSPRATLATVAGEEQSRALISMSDLARLAETAARVGGNSNENFAETFNALGNETDPLAALQLRAGLFLTKELKPRKVVVTKAVAEQHPDLVERCRDEAERLAGSLARMANLEMIEASQSLFVVANAILERYQSLKRNRGFVDFGDMIGKAANLLARSDVREWVQYKLDRGIDHVLIDEAQDTSPRQWEIINAIIEDFHSGRGASEATRTVFAVGDEKQSIYSFQGADPAGFSRQRAIVSRRAESAGQPFRSVPLNLSFRSTPDVLAAVDAVFALEENARGLSASGDRSIHSAIRASDAGDVRIWPLFASEKAPRQTDWLAPIDAPVPSDPAIRLANRIAATIEEWIGSGERLPGAKRSLRHGDILILVRKRDRFVPAIIRELKKRGMAIAGADRLHLTEHVAVEDLMALGRVMCLPEDDLALAALLKSPICGFDDDDLVAIAPNRKGRPLIERLQEISRSGAGDMPLDKISDCLTLLGELRNVAAHSSVYRFYAHALGAAGCRAALLSRFGTEAEDVLDAFEQAALAHETAGDGSLEGFLASLSRSPPQIKREIDMTRDEIRVITAHSAKGLEAPVVFLVDPCSRGFVSQLAPKVVGLSRDDATAGYLWRHSGTANALDSRMQEIEQDAEAEYRRLLYVAMTRAADRLVVCGYAGLRSPPEHHWHSMILRALGGSAEQVLDAEGNVIEHVWRRSSPPADNNGTEIGSTDEGRQETGLPDPMFPDPVFPALAAPELPLPRPLNPSLAGLALGRRTVETSDDGLPGPAAQPADPLLRRNALERGNATHKLLQYLPDITPGDRAATARAWLSLNLPEWSADMRESIISKVIAILDAPGNAGMFGPGSKAEAGIAGTISIGGTELPVSGQIDRLAVSDDQVIVCDYKTNRIVPDNDSRIDPAYLLQMALYRELLKQIFPGRRIVCRLVWVENGKVSEPDDSLLDEALTGIMASVQAYV